MAKWSQGPGTFDHMVPGTRDHWLNFDWDQGPKLKGPQGPGTILKLRIYFICRYSEECLKNPKDKTYKGNKRMIHTASPTPSGNSDSVPIRFIKVQASKLGLDFGLWDSGLGTHTQNFQIPKLRKNSNTCDCVRR